MPLRDHFRPPLDQRTSWEGFYGQWPAMIVFDLVRLLPSQYIAEPRAQSGVAVETNLLDADEYAVRIYDVEHGRRLVAAIEIVSPANKDRPEHRQAFVGKCAALLRQGVAVSVVDLVTTRHFNLYTDLFTLVGHNGPTLSVTPPGTYAAACRWIERGRKHILEAWDYPLTVGQLLPTLPLWLTENLAVPLELEASYEETCRALRIG